MLRLVRAAVTQAVAQVVNEIVDDGGPVDPVIRLDRPPVRQRAVPENEVPENATGGGLIGIPSYQDKGRPVGVPVAAGGSPTSPVGSGVKATTDPLVTAVNDLAVRVRQAELAPPVRPSTAPGGGLFNWMWASGQAKDTARLMAPTRADLERLEERLIGA